jgi:alpha-D-xyloside xylohydrolase
VREGAVLPIGARDDRPDYDYLDGLVLEVYPCPTPSLVPGIRVVTVTTPTGDSAEFTVEQSEGRVRVTSECTSPWSVKVKGGPGGVAQHNGEAVVEL